MKEKTFEELIEEKLTATKEGYVVYTDDIKELLQQVREATTEEFCQALLDVPLPAGTVRKIGKIAITTDRIKLTEK